MKAGIRISLAFAWLLCTGGCPQDVTAPADVACGDGETIVAFDTADGVTLRADLWSAPQEATGAVVLFHMKPPGYDRRDWPEPVRQTLAELGVTVLNVDRRGGGESGGVAVEAYEGPGARLDMEAAVRFLVDGGLGCPVDGDRLALVGASNGTTAVMDYSVAHDGELPDPVALIWMSPGEYTENQHAVADHRDTLDTLPILWLYPETEPWSEAFAEHAPEAWSMDQRGQEHGTDMFDGGALEQLTVEQITGWVADNL